MPLVAVRHPDFGALQQRRGRAAVRAVCSQQPQYVYGQRALYRRLLLLGGARAAAATAGSAPVQQPEQARFEGCLWDKAWYKAWGMEWP